MPQAFEIIGLGEGTMALVNTFEVIWPARPCKAVSDKPTPFYIPDIKREFSLVRTPTAVVREAAKQ
jgi:hypothetical protein